MKKIFLMIMLSLSVQSCRDVNSGGKGGAEVPTYLDTSFGDAGKVNTDFSAGYDVINDIILQPDGKIIAVGTTGTPMDPKFMIVRYNVNGTVDPSFKSGTAAGFFFCVVPYSAFLDSEGRVVVAGASDGVMAVIRLNNDGTLDETFGEKGKLTATVGERSSAFCAALGSNDSVVLGGFTVSGQKEEMAFVKLDKDGATNSEFKGPERSGSGKFSVKIGTGNSRIYAMKSKNDNLVAVGTAFNGSNYDFAIVKLKADGEQDPGFGTGSQVIINSNPGGDDVLKSLVWLDNGKILVAGFSAVDTTKNFNVVIYRLNEDGSLDTGFGNGGSVKLPWTVPLYGGPLLSGFVKMSVNQESIFVASEPEVDGHTVFGVARLTKDGQLDSAYGQDGLITTDWSEGHQNAAAHAIAIQPDGKAVVGGYSALNSNYNFALARYK